VLSPLPIQHSQLGLAQGIASAQPCLKTAVIGRHQLTGDIVADLHLAEYDRRSSLVVAPTVEFVTFLGGNSQDYGVAVTVDPQGNAYVTGPTQSVNFPTSLYTTATLKPMQQALDGSMDAFVLKVGSDGYLTSAIRLEFKSVTVSNICQGPGRADRLVAALRGLI
jgi:hypothetical protein